LSFTPLLYQRTEDAGNCSHPHLYRWGVPAKLKRGFGLDEFMVRAKKSINRILFLCVLAFISLTILLYKAKYSMVRFAQKSYPGFPFVQRN